MEAFLRNLRDVLSTNVVQVALSALAALAVLFIGFRLIRLIMRLFQRSKAAQRMDPTVQTFLHSLISFVLKALLVVVVCGIVGIPTASIIAVLGSAGVAIGLAMQGSLSNFAGGVMLLLFKPFEKGNYIEVANCPAGTVTDISIFYTTLLTLDNKRVVIPNGAGSNATLTNYSAMPERRIDMDFSVSYEADIDTVRACILTAATQCEHIKDTPAPLVYMNDMADSAVLFRFQGWCDSKDYFNACFAIRESVKRALDAAGISIPYPQMDVHVK